MGLVKMNLQFTAVQIYSCFLSAKACSRNVAAEQRLVDCHFLKSGARREKKGLSQSSSAASSTRKLLVEKRDYGGERRPPRSGSWRVGRWRGRMFRFREVK